MKFRQLRWLADFVLMFVTFVAGIALFRLHAAGQPILALVIEAVFAGAFFSLFNYIREHEDR